jgi:hypothetical protein
MDVLKRNSTTRTISFMLSRNAHVRCDTTESGTVASHKCFDKLKTKRDNSNCSRVVLTIMHIIYYGVNIV